MHHYQVIEEAVNICLRNVDQAIKDIEVGIASKPYSSSYVFFQINEFIRFNNMKSVESIPFILQDDEPPLESHDSHLVMHMNMLNHVIQKSSSLKSKDTVNQKKKILTFVKNSNIYHYQTQQVYDTKDYQIEKVYYEEVVFDQETEERRLRHFEKIAKKQKQESYDQEKFQKEKIQRDQIQKAIQKGIPYTFDYDGSLIEKKKTVPQNESYPFQTHNNNNNNNNTLLQQKELQRLQSTIYNRNSMDLSAKKKLNQLRISSSSLYEQDGEEVIVQNKKILGKLKVNELQTVDKNHLYNNNGLRQTSFIPFIKVSDSVIYKERQGSRYKELRPSMEKKKQLNYKQFQELLNHSIDQQSIQNSLQGSEVFSIKQNQNSVFIPVYLEGIKASIPIESSINKTLPLVQIPRSKSKNKQLKQTEEELFISEFQSVGQNKKEGKKLLNKKYNVL